ncbi:MAG: RT0821/Lpp0805 family surface protein [Candidatus Berkiellales bacterium]
MKSNIKLLILLVTAGILAGCQSTGQSNNTPMMMGTSSGKVIGAQYYPGSNQAAGVGAGALFGDTTGNGIGRAPNQSDVHSAHNGFVKATRVPIGETVYWHNKRTSHWGTFCPIRDGHSLCGNYCREFVTTTFIDGRAERTYGTACRRPNGTWELM